MRPDTTHPEYDLMLPQWERARAIIAGEDAIKSAGQSHLPRVSGHTDEEYKAYKSRATFYNATARTAQAYLGMLFRKPPVVPWPT